MVDLPPSSADQADSNPSSDEPLGLKQPLQPAQPLGVNRQFLVPLGARSLSILDLSIFQADPIQADFLDNPFLDSPFFPSAVSTPSSPPTETHSTPTTLQRQQSKNEAKTKNEVKTQHHLVNHQSEAGLAQPQKLNIDRFSSEAASEAQQLETETAQNLELEQHQTGCSLENISFVEPKLKITPLQRQIENNQSLEQGISIERQSHSNFTHSDSTDLEPIDSTQLELINTFHETEINGSQNLEKLTNSDEQATLPGNSSASLGNSTSIRQNLNSSKFETISLQKQTENNQNTESRILIEQQFQPVSIQSELANLESIDLIQPKLINTFHETEINNLENLEILTNSDEQATLPDNSSTSLKDGAPIQQKPDFPHKTSSEDYQNLQLPQTQTQAVEPNTTIPTIRREIDSAEVRVAEGKVENNIENDFPDHTILGQKLSLPEVTDANAEIASQSDVIQTKSSEAWEDYAQNERSQTRSRSPVFDQAPSATNIQANSQQYTTSQSSPEFETEVSSSPQAHPAFQLESSESTTLQTQRDLAAQPYMSSPEDQVVSQSSLQKQPQGNEPSSSNSQENLRISPQLAPEENSNPATYPASANNAEFQENTEYQPKAEVNPSNQVRIQAYPSSNAIVRSDLLGDDLPEVNPDITTSGANPDSPDRDLSLVDPDVATNLESPIHLQAQQTFESSQTLEVLVNQSTETTDDSNLQTNIQSKLEQEPQITVPPESQVPNSEVPLTVQAQASSEEPIASKVEASPQLRPSVEIEVANASINSEESVTSEMPTSSEAQPSVEIANPLNSNIQSHPSSNQFAYPEVLGDHPPSPNFDAVANPNPSLHLQAQQEHESFRNSEALINSSSQAQYNSRVSNSEFSPSNSHEQENFEEKINLDTQPSIQSKPFLGEEFSATPIDSEGLATLSSFASSEAQPLETQSSEVNLQLQQSNSISDSSSLQANIEFGLEQNQPVMAQAESQISDSELSLNTQSFSQEPVTSKPDWNLQAKFYDDQIVDEAQTDVNTRSQPVFDVEVESIIHPQLRMKPETEVNLNQPSEPAPIQSQQETETTEPLDNLTNKQGSLQQTASEFTLQMQSQGNSDIQVAPQSDINASIQRNSVSEVNSNFSLYGVESNLDSSGNTSPLIEGDHSSSEVQTEPQDQVNFQSQVSSETIARSNISDLELTQANSDSKSVLESFNSEAPIHIQAQQESKSFVRSNSLTNTPSQSPFHSSQLKSSPVSIQAQVNSEEMNFIESQTNIHPHSPVETQCSDAKVVPEEPLSVESQISIQAQQHEAQVPEVAQTNSQSQSEAQVVEVAQADVQTQLKPEVSIEAESLVHFPHPTNSEAEVHPPDAISPRVGVDLEQADRTSVQTSLSADAEVNSDSQYSNLSESRNSELTTIQPHLDSSSTKSSLKPELLVDDLSHADIEASDFGIQTSGQNQSGFEAQLNEPVDLTIQQVPLDDNAIGLSEEIEIQTHLEPQHGNDWRSQANVSPELNLSTSIQPQLNAETNDYPEKLSDNSSSNIIKNSNILENSGAGLQFEPPSEMYSGGQDLIELLSNSQIQRDAQTRDTSDAPMPMQSQLDLEAESIPSQQDYVQPKLEIEKQSSPELSISSQPESKPEAQNFEFQEQNQVKSSASSESDSILDTSSELQSRNDTYLEQQAFSDSSSLLVSKSDALLHGHADDAVKSTIQVTQPDERPQSGNSISEDSSQSNVLPFSSQSELIIQSQAEETFIYESKNNSKASPLINSERSDPSSSKTSEAIIQRSQQVTPTNEAHNSPRTESIESVGNQPHQITESTQTKPTPNSNQDIQAAKQDSSQESFDLIHVQPSSDGSTFSLNAQEGNVQFELSQSSDLELEVSLSGTSEAAPELQTSPELQIQHLTNELPIAQLRTTEQSESVDQSEPVKQPESTIEPNEVLQLPQVWQDLTVLRSLIRRNITQQPEIASQLESSQAPYSEIAPSSKTSVKLQRAFDSDINSHATIATGSLPDQWSSLADLVEQESTSSARSSTSIQPNSNPYQSSPASVQSQQKTVNTNLDIQAQFIDSPPVRVTRYQPPTPIIARQEEEVVTEDQDKNVYLEAVAQAIYHRLRQRMRVEQERHGRDYFGRLPW